MNAQTTRRGVLQMFGITLGALSTGAAAGIGKPATVTQRELQQLVALWNRGEVMAAQIRRRLEAGATFERGSIGVSTFLEESLAEYEANDGIGEAASVTWCGLKVAPAKSVAKDAALLRMYPNPGALVLC